MWLAGEKSSSGKAQGAEGINAYATLESIPVGARTYWHRKNQSCTDLHKPKPVHNFREFLSELGVVVLGIVIALSGEQLIESLHDKHKAGEAREGIRDEIEMNIAVLESRSAAQPCIDRRIDDIATLLGSRYSTTSGRAPGLTHSVYA
jgi:hypothetical protein